MSLTRGLVWRVLVLAIGIIAVAQDASALCKNCRWNAVRQQETCFWTTEDGWVLCGDDGGECSGNFECTVGCTRQNGCGD